MQAINMEHAATPQTLDEWHEDDGSVLWWVFPVCEPPWCGTPNDSEWPGYHTHWTPIVMPNEPECDIPPFGWRCTRGIGHSGPCAAVECPEDAALVERGMARLRETPNCLICAAASLS